MKYIATVEKAEQEIVCCIPDLQLPHIERPWVWDRQTVEEWVTEMKVKHPGSRYRIYELVEAQEK